MAELVTPSDTMTTVLFVLLLFFQAVTYKKGCCHKCMGTLSGGGWQKRRIKFTNLEDLTKITLNFFFFLSCFGTPFLLTPP